MVHLLAELEGQDGIVGTLDYHDGTVIRFSLEIVSN